jgi:flagellar biosynthesis protein FlhG
VSKVVSDQADGLRNLMAQHSGTQAARVIALVGSSPRIGVTSVALNLAAALVQQGKEVLLLDEQSGARSATAMWAGATARSWSDVAGGLPLSTAASRLACGALLLAVRPGDAPAVAEVRNLFQGQVILVDAGLDRDGALSPLAAQADDVVVLLRPQAASITAAYACIKQLHYAHALQRLRIMLNLAAGMPEAQRVLGNLAGAGSRYLGLALEPAGCVAEDPQLVRALGLKLSVVEAFQTSAAAIDFRRIAGQLLQWPRPVVNRNLDTV